VKLGIQIDKKFQKYLREEWLQQVVEQILATQNIDSEVEVGLLITDDKTVRTLNKSYRGLDEPTDVLSFALTEKQPGNDSPFVNPPDGILHLGEVIISYPQAVRQAKENNHRVEQEVALLIIHGVLHLLGYEHDKPAKEKEMRALEKKVLSEVEKWLK